MQDCIDDWRKIQLLKEEVSELETDLKAIYSELEIYEKALEMACSRVSYLDYRSDLAKERLVTTYLTLAKDELKKAREV